MKIVDNVITHHFVVSLNPQTNSVGRVKLSNSDKVINGTNLLKVTCDKQNDAQ